ncbi:MAG: hypothetical protein SW833_24915 [Cyanobacteriota bacterium]|nr:hypothetical protein [Cyanobacteriota bacterium]
MKVIVGWELPLSARIQQILSLLAMYTASSYTKLVVYPLTFSIALLDREDVEFGECEMFDLNIRHSLEAIRARSPLLSP